MQFVAALVRAMPQRLGGEPEDGVSSEHCRREPRDGVLACIGWTPLVRLRRLEADAGGGELWAKLEWTNPGGSVKDRAALAIVLAARDSPSSDA